VFEGRKIGALNLVADLQELVTAARKTLKKICGT
jgi:hypothetical protein